MDIWPLLRIDLERGINEVFQTLGVLRAWMFVLRIHDCHRNGPALFRSLRVLERRM